MTVWKKVIPWKKWALFWISVLDLLGCSWWLSFLQPIWKKGAKSKWIISPSRGENKTCLKSAPEKMDFTGVIHPERSGVMFFCDLPKKKARVLRIYMYTPAVQVHSHLHWRVQWFLDFLGRFHTSEESSHLLIQKLLRCNNPAMRRHTAMPRER